MGVCADYYGLTAQIKLSGARTAFPIGCRSCSPSVTADGCSSWNERAGTSITVTDRRPRSDVNRLALSQNARSRSSPAADRSQMSSDLPDCGLHRQLVKKWSVYCSLLHWCGAVWVAFVSIHWRIRSVSDKLCD